jgi:hypothetical protein
VDPIATVQLDQLVIRLYVNVLVAPALLRHVVHDVILVRSVPVNFAVEEVVQDVQMTDVPLMQIVEKTSSVSPAHLFVYQTT